jgi:hypothetical protein
MELTIAPDVGMSVAIDAMKTVGVREPKVNLSNRLCSGKTPVTWRRWAEELEVEITSTGDAYCQLSIRSWAPSDPGVMRWKEREKLVDRLAADVSRQCPNGRLEVQTPKDCWDDVLSVFDQLLRFLRTSGESVLADEILRYRAPLEGEDKQGATDLLVALRDSRGPLSELVVQSADGREMSGREFSAANRCLRDLYRAVIEATEAVLKV